MAHCAELNGWVQFDGIRIGAVRSILDDCQRKTFDEFESRFFENLRIIDNGLGDSTNIFFAFYEKITIISRYLVLLDELIASLRALSTERDFIGVSSLCEHRDDNGIRTIYSFEEDGHCLIAKNWHQSVAANGTPHGTSQPADS